MAAAAAFGSPSQSHPRCARNTVYIHGGRLPDSRSPPALHNCEPSCDDGQQHKQLQQHEQELRQQQQSQPPHCRQQQRPHGKVEGDEDSELNSLWERRRAKAAELTSRLRLGDLGSRDKASIHGSGFSSAYYSPSASLPLSSSLRRMRSRNPSKLIPTPRGDSRTSSARSSLQAKAPRLPESHPSHPSHPSPRIEDSRQSLAFCSPRPLAPTRSLPAPPHAPATGARPPGGADTPSRVFQSRSGSGSGRGPAPAFDSLHASPCAAPAPGFCPRIASHLCPFPLSPSHDPSTGISLSPSSSSSSSHSSQSHAARPTVGHATPPSAAPTGTVMPLDKGSARLLRQRPSALELSAVTNCAGLGSDLYSVEVLDAAAADDVGGTWTAAPVSLGFPPSTVKRELSPRRSDHEIIKHSLTTAGSSHQWLAPEACDASSHHTHSSSSGSGGSGPREVYLIEIPPSSDDSPPSFHARGRNTASGSSAPSHHRRKSSSSSNASSSVRSSMPSSPLGPGPWKASTAGAAALAMASAAAVEPDWMGGIAGKGPAVTRHQSVEDKELLRARSSLPDAAQQEGATQPRRVRSIDLSNLGPKEARQSTGSAGVVTQHGSSGCLSDLPHAGWKGTELEWGTAEHSTGAYEHGSTRYGVNPVEDLYSENVASVGLNEEATMVTGEDEAVYHDGPKVELPTAGLGVRLEGDVLVGAAPWGLACGQEELAAAVAGGGATAAGKAPKKSSLRMASRMAFGQAVVACTSSPRGRSSLSSPTLSLTQGKLCRSLEEDEVEEDALAGQCPLATAPNTASAALAIAQSSWRGDQIVACHRQQQQSRLERNLLDDEDSGAYKIMQQQKSQRVHHLEQQHEQQERQRKLERHLSSDDDEVNDISKAQHDKIRPSAVSGAKPRPTFSGRNPSRRTCDIVPEPKPARNFSGPGVSSSQKTAMVHAGELDRKSSSGARQNYKATGLAEGKASSARFGLQKKLQRSLSDDDADV